MTAICMTCGKPAVGKCEGLPGEVWGEKPSEWPDDIGKLKWRIHELLRSTKDMHDALHEAATKNMRFEVLLVRMFAWTAASREGIKTDPDPQRSLANLVAFEAEVRAALASKEEIKP